ncbi:Dynein heavy chain 8, axonemal [Sciurus carolinensis]|uniref:Dynein heavy chain 8, axonemal n=1 Tax=Sciurus carolinensis TaxID=30640 RepID=A0AA41SQI9_SCICA|nr:Dynein heavy chain 8, axonemal [Sciurus carolinensis]
MSSEEGGPSVEEPTPPSGDTAPPPSGDEAPPPSGEETPPPPAMQDPGDFTLSVEGDAPSVSEVSDYRDLIPSEEEDEGESQSQRVRPRMAPRPVQSALSDVLSQSSRRSSKYRRSMSGIPNLQETLKERQARFRDARENRKSKIDPSYRYIFEILAAKLGLDLITVEELILDCPSEVLFTVLDASDGLLNGIKSMLSSIFLPAILATSNWGALNQSKQGESEKHIFTETINRYLSFLDGARISIEGTVMLKKIDNIDFSKLHTFEEVTAAASNSETVRQLEEVLMIWYKQIEQVLIESEQMRKEADDSGPLTELEHWKRMSAKFNYIIEQIKGSSCKAVINVLTVAHSKLLKNWRDLDARITDTANESKDNVRYLYTLEKVCQPLYNYDLI